ncbi:MAG: NBR1-Ig-like domain-containing protein, partial [Anaerolineales bacterium]|nr:NBR1-Ig-like domain-containing protein [Anaerolineales bacterium]
MVKQTIYKLIAILMVILLSACNMPRSSISPAEQTAIINTSVAETVAAGSGDPTQTGDPAAVTDTPDPGAGETVTPTATNTPEADTPTPSNTPIPCNLGKFVTDVSIPDGTVFEPGEAFTKTWRLKNVGSCAWTSGYDIVFSGGDAMSAPSSVQLTSGSVSPGQNVEVSVNLTAPATAGTYRGNWQLRDPSDVIFRIENSSSGFFWVEIKVKEPAPTENTVEIALASRGQVEDGLDVRTNANNAGDTSHDVGLQGFVTFDVSGIPNGATILSAKLVSASHDVLGDPFGSLGCLRAYVHNYDTVGYEDFKPVGVTGALVKFCSEAEVDTASLQIMNSAGIAGIQAALASNAFQIRLQFKDMHSDGDGIAD